MIKTRMRTLQLLVCTALLLAGTGWAADDDVRTMLAGKTARSWQFKGLKSWMGQAMGGHDECHGQTGQVLKFKADGNYSSIACQNGKFEQSEGTYTIGSDNGDVTITMEKLGTFVLVFQGDSKLRLRTNSTRPGVATVNREYSLLNE